MPIVKVCVLRQSVALPVSVVWYSSQVFVYLGQQRFAAVDAVILLVQGSSYLMAGNSDQFNQTERERHRADAKVLVRLGCLEFQVWS